MDRLDEAVQLGINVIDTCRMQHAAATLSRRPSEADGYERRARERRSATAKVGMIR